jgi:ABC-type transport system involved in multi-copper enzyme maturation permease subunit
MITSLKSELKKLMSVRSTYGWCLVALIFLLIGAFYADGFKDSANLQSGPDKGSLFIASTIAHLPNVIALFGGLIAILLITHEYRYNTIIYTLTASNSRTKTLLSKIITVLGFTLVYSILFTAISVGLIYAGAALAHNVIPHQDINYLTFFGKILFFVEGYTLAALLFGTLIRNQVGAIAALLILPGTLESLLTLVLKKNSVYLPFTALSQVTQPPVIGGAKAAHPARDLVTGSLSPAKGAVVFLCYLVVSWVIGWYLFLRRDAT